MLLISTYWRIQIYICRPKTFLFSKLLDRINKNCIYQLMGLNWRGSTWFFPECRFDVISAEGLQLMAGLCHRWRCQSANANGSAFAFSFAPCASHNNVENCFLYQFHTLRKQFDFIASSWLHVQLLKSLRFALGIPAPEVTTLLRFQAPQKYWRLEP